MNARLTTSLSPIFSIIKGFLVIDKTAEVFAGPKLRDMCSDVGADLLLSTIRKFLLPGNGDFVIFFTPDWNENMGVETNGGVEDFGVEVCQGLTAGDKALFLPTKFLSILVGIA